MYTMDDIKNLPTHDEALEAQKKAERLSVACLHNECAVEGTPVYDKNGKLMTKDEITLAMLNEE